MENKTKHTPGPWQFLRNNDLTWTVATDKAIPTNNTAIARNINARNNAVLIAAAPELLALCKETLEAVDLDGQNRKELRKALQVAISKAEGKS